MGGSGGSSGGGGGSSGKVDYPTYIKESHKYLLAGAGDSPYNGSATNGVFSSIEDAKSANPFGALAAFDPTTYLGDAQTQFDVYVAAVAALDDIPDWKAFANVARAYFIENEPLVWEELVERARVVCDENLLSEQYVDDAVAAQADALAPELAESRVRISGSMADVGAAQGSAIQIALALLGARFNVDLGKFRADLKFKMHGDRLDFIHKSVPQIIGLEADRKGTIMEAVGQMMQLFNNRLAHNKDLAALVTELNRLKIVAFKEQTDKEIQLVEDDALWEIKLWQYGSNVLAAPGGGTAVYKNAASAGGGSAIGGAIGGALAGAGAGAQIGGKTGVGAGWGAAGGAIVGGIGGYFASG